MTDLGAITWPVQARDSYWSIAESLLAGTEVGSDRDFIYSLQLKIIDLNQAHNGSNDANLLQCDALALPRISNHCITPHDSSADVARSSPGAELDQNEFDELLAGEKGGFAGSSFKHEIVFPSIDFPGSLCFCHCVFNGDVDFVNASVAGFACFQHAVFNGHARFRSFSVGDDLAFEYSSFSRDAIFENVNINGNFGLNILQADSAIYIGDGTTVGGSIFVGRLNGGPGGFYLTNSSIAGLYGYKMELVGPFLYERVGRSTAVSLCSSNFGDTVKIEAAPNRLTYLMAVSKTASRRETESPAADDPLRFLSLRDSLIADRLSIVASVRQRADFSDLSTKGPVEITAGAPAGSEAATCLIDLRSIVIGGRSRLIFGRSSVEAAELRAGDSAEVEVAEVSLNLSNARLEADTVLSAIAALDGSTPGAGTSRLVSVYRTDLRNAAIAGFDLSSCRFAGAYGLDSVRIEDTVKWGTVPRSRITRLRTRRRVLTEEMQIRVDRREAGWTVSPELQLQGPIGPLDVAAIYRTLRKGLEDRKNEPSAADFYYGEMEMRRIGATSAVERGILTAYWISSGYALRAWRAMVALGLSIAICGVLIALVGFQPPTAIPLAVADPTGGAVRLVWLGANGQLSRDRSAVEIPSSFAENLVPAVTYAAESAVVVFRANEPRALTTAGRWVQVFARLLGPLFLGLALLSLRGRVKR